MCTHILFHVSMLRAQLFALRDSCQNITFTRSALAYTRTCPATCPYTGTSLPLGFAKQFEISSLSLSLRLV